MNYPRTAIVIAAASLSIAVLGQGHKAMATQKANVVVDNGFKPSTISVKVGKPVQLTFDTKHHGCASKIVFTSMHMSKAIQDGKKTVFTFTPKKSGKLTFTCDMGMYNGTVVVK